MFNCPHCGQLGLSLMRRMCTSPLIPASCTVCGKKIGTVYVQELIAVIPFLLGLMAAEDLTSSYPLKTVLVAAGMTASIVLHVVWVRLVKR